MKRNYKSINFGFSEMEMKQLVSNLKQNQSVWTTIFDENANDFSKYVKSMNRTLSTDEVDDLIAETYAVFWQRAPNFKQHSGVRAYFFKILKTVCVKYFEEQRKLFVEPIDNIGDVEEDTDAEEKEVLLGLLAAGLKLLDAEDVNIIHLRHFREPPASHEEIAKIYGIKLEASKQRYSRAKKTLKKRINELKNKL
jgi:RNA polymerase sigma factor (sigma-70 family)